MNDSHMRAYPCQQYPSSLLALCPPRLGFLGLGLSSRLSFLSLSGLGSTLTISCFSWVCLGLGSIGFHLLALPLGLLLGGQ